MKKRLAAASAALLLAAAPASAKITRLVIEKTEPAFGGQIFGAAGAYQRLTGKAHGELDPKLPGNAIIQDIALAPRNARGMVEYVTDIDIFRPADLSKGNGALLFDIVNRGNKLALRNFNANLPGLVPEWNAAREAGDGFLMREGYTVIFFGWQADLLIGNNRIRLAVPVAKNADGSPVTGIVRTELYTHAPSKTLNLSSGWFTQMTHQSYPTISADNKKPLADGFLPSLTVRDKEQEPRRPVANTAWSFGACTDSGVTVNDTQICMPAGFEPGKLYELIYRAKDPTVIGIGYAATRDVATFFKNRDKDDAGTANPVFRKGNKAIVVGTSQSGRFIRSFIHLGFNRGEDGRVAYEAAFPHIGGGLMPMNVRFGQPGRAWGDQIDHLYPAYDFPFSYARQNDPLTGRTQGILDRCAASKTCPKIFHVATALEVWEGRQSLGLTDPLGQRDVRDPENVRTFIMASTQHGTAPLPLPTAQPFGNCQQQGNPNPQLHSMRALITALKDWTLANKTPPASAIPRIADGTLTAPHQVRFPPIPANAYGNVQRPAMKMLAVHNPLHVLDFGPGYRAGDTSGIGSIDPPKSGTASYGVLVPQVDADGNDTGGLRSVHLQAPVGTYTGWNYGRAGRFESGFCSLSGSFVPFAKTRAEREAAGDSRLSIEERYPSKEAYVAVVKKAADALVQQRMLLADDAAALIKQAETEGVRLAP